MTPTPLKIVFVTGSLVYNSLVVEKVLKSQIANVCAIIIGDFIYPKKNLFQGAQLVIRKAGVRYFIFKVFETMIFTFMALLKGKKGKIHTFDQLTAIYNVPIFKTRDLNAPEEVARIKSLHPDLIISMIPQMIKDEIMKTPRIGVINLHPGLLPEYRAFGGYFWPLVDGFGSYGYTIHFINEIIDGGDIIKREAFPISSDSTVQCLYYQSMKYGGDGLLTVLNQFSQDHILRKPQDINGYDCHPWPNASAIRIIKKKGYALFRFKDLFKIFRNDF